ncbi:FlhC family transcriptional regulator [Thiomicrorhabdus aquaedulcis]|uniref:FlhC family transcriptional regulator n=1 Tax=Thiomicrorhabdus aquaedulcis TaxID=2211106 RepID=UPI001562B28B|nr:FlhC family transcriptional regulator [Thiomicrorhabdus aquaedulcis]
MDELELALLMRKIIELGGSPTDLQFMFPEYFGYEACNARAKAQRIYKSFRPLDDRITVKRITQIGKLIKVKSKLILASDFTKLVFPAIKAAKKDANLIEVFTSCYEAWLDNFESNKPSASLSFQQAFAVFRYVTNSIDRPELLEFDKCKNCGAHYPKFKISPKESCPYC